MNLFDQHDKPEILYGHDKKHLTPPFAYAKVFKDRSLIGNTDIEDAISKDGAYSHRYANSILKGRFKKGEPAIAKRASDAADYARFVLRGKFPEAEPAIATHPAAAYGYAMWVLKGRFIAGEPAISKSSAFAAAYAGNILKAPWPEVEPTIADYPFRVELYLKRFPERREAMEKLQGKAK